MRKLAMGLLGALIVYVAIGALLHYVVFPEPTPPPELYPTIGDAWGSEAGGTEQRVLDQEGDRLYMEVRVMPGAQGPPEHVHTSFEEDFHIQSGTLTLWVDGERRQLGPGESFSVPPGAGHTVINEGSEIAVSRHWRSRDHVFFLSQIYGFMNEAEDGVALSEFLIGELASQVDMTTIDGKARLAELAKPLIHKIPQGVYRELLIDSLANKVGLSAAKLEKMLGKAPRSGTSAISQSAAVTRRSRGNVAAGRPSIVRRAITLLLNHPDAATKLDIESLAGVSRPGVELLRDLIETVQEEPNITTAGLLERWRHDDEGRHLGKLAALEVRRAEAGSTPAAAVLRGSSHSRHRAAVGRGCDVPAPRVRPGPPRVPQIAFGGGGLSPSRIDRID